MTVRAYVESADEAPPNGSYSEAIRNRMLATAISLPFFASFMPRLTRALPIQTEDLPILGCYIGEETMIPEGDWDAGALKFIVNVRLGWSIMVAESDKEEAEHRLENAYVALMYGLWTNASLCSFLDTVDYDSGDSTGYNARFEGVMRQSARTVWGPFLLNNETPTAEKQYEMTLQYRRFFTPVIPHDLEEVHVTSRFPAGRTPDQIEQIQQVYQRIFFTQPNP